MIAELLPKGWKAVPFEAAFHGKAKVPKVPRSAYRTAGKFPVVDQGQAFVEGYVDGPPPYSGPLPVIVFGDHTRIFKFVDFPFLAGADGVQVLIPNQDLFDPLFLYYALLNLHIPNRGYNRHFHLLREMLLPLPPLAEQRAITHVLEAIRAVKETTERVHAGLEALQRSLTHHLLAYGPSPLNQSIHEPIPPSHWTTLPLGKAVRRVKGRKPPVVHAQPQPGSLPYLTAECLRTGATEVFVDAQTAAQLPTCGPGDVLLLWDGANAGQAFRGRKGVLASTMVRLDPIPDLEKGFLYHFLRSQFPTLNGQTTGSTIPHVNKVVFENLPLPLPSLAEQQAMVAPLQAIEDRLEAERGKLKALEVFFRSLLRELVTGRRRLPEAFVARFREEGGAA